MGAIPIWIGIKKIYQSQLIEDIPRSKIRSMAMGLVEIHGQFVMDKFCLSPFTQTKCLYYKCEVQEYRHRGKDTQGWETIYTSEKRLPFFAKDETGQVLVNPEKAEFNLSPKKVFLQSNNSLNKNPLLNSLKNWDKNPSATLNINSSDLMAINPKWYSWQGNRLGNRKYLEYYLESEENFFIIGTADVNPKNLNQHIIQKGNLESAFIISNKNESGVLRSLKKEIFFLLGMGSIFFLFGFYNILKNIGMI